MRNPPSIPVEQLRACVQDQYDLIPVTLEFLPLGLDCNAVYRIVSEQGTVWLLKATPVALYEPGYRLPRYLSDQGIPSVVAPVPTRSGALWTHLEEWIVTVAPFIEGETGWTSMTDAQWKDLGSTFKRIHQVTLPPVGFSSLRKETFDPIPDVRWVRAFETSLAVAETQRLHARDDQRASGRALRSSWMAHQRTIHTVVTTLEKLAEVLQSQTLPYVVCHADLKPANLIRDTAGQVWVVDWDEVMLAPKERDFLSVGEPPVDGSDRAGTPPFWEGYGPAAIDWMVLTYYRYEQVLQDLITCAHNVCFRDDWGEEARAGVVHRFQEILAEGGEMDAAFAAAAHLPRDLPIH